VKLGQYYEYDNDTCLRLTLYLVVSFHINCVLLHCVPKKHPRHFRS